MGIRSLVALLVMAGSALSAADRNESLAHDGQIDEQAAVKASSEIFIAAPPAKVWSILTAIADWPKWQPDIASAKIAGPLERGTEFKWTAGKTEIVSHLALVKPDEEIAWTGTALHATAIHVWQLRATPNGGTTVSTKESMNGFLLRVFYSSKKLKESQESWLAALKREAER